MRVIGITGGVGSGKSRVLDILEQNYHAQVIQADLVARELMEPGNAGYEKLKSIYGDQILGEDGKIDRPKMAELMFGDSDMRSKVNGIIHPLVWASIRQQIAVSASDLVVVEAALPDENHRDIYTELWYLYTSEENRMARLFEGRGYSRGKTQSIMDSQLSEQQFRSMADMVVDNNGSLEDTRRQIDQLLKDSHEAKRPLP